MNQTSLFLILLATFNILPGCALIRKVAFNYTTARLPESQVVYNVKYWVSNNTDSGKNKLDLFLPTGKDWPVFVFIHGGEWISGDRSLKVMGADIYRNIGRFFASNGIGVAVISYRLMPETDWKSQILDVARAIKWVHQNINKYHGNSKALFVGGHSSGAQLAVRVALDPAPLLSLGSSAGTICGVIPISGAGFDLTDQATYDVAKKDDLFMKLFHKDDISTHLRRQMSPQRFVTSRSPPFLILYAGKEELGLQNGSITLNEKLLKFGIRSQLYEIHQKGHRTIVLNLSQPEQLATGMMLVFMKSLTCEP